MGVCHVYIDSSAEPVMARRVAVNAKISRPSTCNSAETILVHSDVTTSILPGLVADLVSEGVEVRGDERVIKEVPSVIPAKDEDWETEYLDMIVSIKVVNSLTEAVDHINRYGTGHSESILTDSYKSSQYFLRNVDAAAVYVNASTRFTDGGEFGFGAEMGISTQKLHARGPMGLEQLTSVKYIARGNGQTR
jgi:glutamate-5-semialdehyde dehydrogenase